MTVIERETPSVGAARANADSNDEDALEEDILTYDYDEYSDLVSLRRGLKRAVRVYERTKAHSSPRQAGVSSGSRRTEQSVASSASTTQSRGRRFFQMFRRD